MPADSNKSSINMHFKADIKLGKNLSDNIFQFKKVFQDDDTFRVRSFTNQKQPDAKFCVLYIDGMVDVQTANRTIMEPIIQCHLTEKYDIDSILNHVVINNYAEKAYTPEQMVEGIIRGETVLLMDHCSEALIISTKGWKSRSIAEPENEKVLRGPREGFVEPILVNLSLIRRRLATPNLKFKFMTLGTQTKTKVCVSYIEGIVNNKILSEVLDRLNKVSIDSVLGSNYLVELTTDAPYSPFKTIGSTERPDVAVAKLLEGRIIIILDGTPEALTMPFLFEEYFQNDEDYYINFYYSSISRFLRFFGFVLTISTAGLYVAFMCFHWEMMPVMLLVSVLEAREAIPFPTIIETLGLLVTFEILREAGSRMPINIGQSLSILGALVLGTAAVEARIVSAPVIVIVALSGLTGLMIPKIKGPSIILRYFLVLLSGFLGLYGFMMGSIIIMIHLCGIRSFGIPYMVSFTSLGPEGLKDTIFRLPLWFMKKRPKFISGENKIRQANGGQ